MRLTEDELALLVAYVREASGIVLGPDSAVLLESRLGPLLESAGLSTGTELLARLRDPRSTALRDRVMDRITTHETSFFRDRGPFDALRGSVLPELAERLQGQRAARVWCAACSTGQEPYSVAMLADEMRPRLADLELEILATDLSREALARARSGVYSQLEVNRGLTPEHLKRHFEPEGRHWRISRPLRRMVQFRQQNLTSDSPPHGWFDVILCRNVLIYLDLGVRPRVFAALHEKLAPEGYLFLGAAESPQGMDLRFHHFGPRDHYCYRRQDAQPERRAA
ncbi:MAG TPA: protein-glutamate O-methyltransferase CheR [Candidatus Saccharimonadales bacterium]|nr:protein-glutamate O-methyltransferase CheR [Candidatus Saccharimonadales bacterium]